MSSIATTSSGSQYTDEQRQQAIANYIVTGNITKTAELVNIPRRTINQWKLSEWWDAAVAKMRLEKHDELDANLSNIIHSATEALSERIASGDAYIDKEGEVRLKPMSGRDLATVTGIIFDKRQIMRNLPTSIKAESTDARLNSLAEKVRELQGGMVTIEGKAEEIK